MAIYIFGKNIPLPMVELNAKVLEGFEGRSLLENLMVMTGGSISSLNLFSLGVGPWMTAMILWRFVTVFGLVKGLTGKRSYQAQFLLSFLIALIQAYATVTASQLTASYVSIVGNAALVKWLLVAVLIAGTYILNWLGNQNGQYGYGGMIIIILTNMILAFVTNLTTYLTREAFTPSRLFLTTVVFVLLVSAIIHLAIISSKAEYRIPIKRVSLTSSYLKHSYIPIKLMPAGAMPFMYGMSLMAIPVYVTALLLRFYPNNTVLIFLYQNVGLTKPLGVILYLLMLYILSIGFAYYNYDAYEIAKNMRNNGDYILDVIPGKPTQDFLSARIKVLARIGAFYTLFISGFPMILALNNPRDTVNLAMLVSNSFIIAIFTFGIVGQIRATQMWKDYQELI